MDSLLNVLKIIGICAAILILFFIAIVILRHYHKRKILRSFSPSRKDVMYVLNMIFGKQNVLKNVYLPIFDETNTITSYVYADTIILLKTGIAVCRFSTESGMISCDYGSTWHQSARLRTGGTRELDFTNPTTNNSKAASAIRKLFSFNNLEEPPVFQHVIFTPKTVSFQMPIENVFTLDEGIKSLKALRKESKLEGDPQAEFYELLNHYMVKKHAAAKYNIEGLD
ncbi:MAG: hypothetical protein MJ236_01150 [Clostridia bacterium]|nr:hypothetical protein [Clostridia bacterium]